MPAPPLQEAFLQETAPPSQEVTGNEMIFDPFADIPSQPQSQPQTTTPTSPDFNEFSPQPMVESAPRPAGLLGLLPPPPTKESVKAANRLKLNSGNASAVTSPTVTSPMATAVAAPPPTTTSQPAPSDGKEMVDLWQADDLEDLHIKLMWVIGQGKRRSHTGAAKQLRVSEK